MYEKKSYNAYLYLAPAIILMLIFIIYPLFNTIFTSFLIDYNFMTGEFARFGVEYYGRVLRHPNFIRAVTNTFVMTAISVPLSIIVSLLIAVALNSIKRLQGFYQTIFFLPYVTNVIAIGMVFSFMFHQNYGLVNTVLGWFGIGAVNWKGAGAGYWQAMTVLTAYTVWNALPFRIMVFLSGLQSIDKQYYQAAQIDATPKWRVFRHITVPLLSPMIMYISITSFIGAFKAYDSVIALYPDRMGTPGNPRQLITIVGFIYEALENTSPGMISRASAAAVILFAMILVFTAVQMQVNKKRVHY